MAEEKLSLENEQLKEVSGGNGSTSHHGYVQCPCGHVWESLDTTDEAAWADFVAKVQRYYDDHMIHYPKRCPKCENTDCYVSIWLDGPW